MTLSQRECVSFINQDFDGVLLQITRLYFVLSGCSVLLAQTFSNRLQPLICYGKTASNVPDRDSSTPSEKLISALSKWTVPRSWFKHFYVLSTIMGISLIVYSSQQTSQIPLLAVLLWTHSLRRFLETEFIEKPSGSRMWIGHYAIGLTFYFFVNLASILDSANCSSARTLDNKFGPWSVMCLCAFYAAQFAQHMIHRQLATIREQCRPGQYINPVTGLFAHCIAPHYTAEIVLYLSLALLDATNLTMWLVALWTATVLTASAQQTDTWGRRKFDDWQNRWIICPGIY